MNQTVDLTATKEQINSAKIALLNIERTIAKTKPHPVAAAELAQLIKRVDEDLWSIIDLLEDRDIH